MIYLYIALFMILIALWIISRIINPPIFPVESSYSRPFLAAAVLIHRWVWAIKKRIQFGSMNNRRGITNKKNISKRLQTLNPGETAETRLYRFSIEKISTVLLILCIGLLIASLISFMAVKGGVLEKGNLIYRNGLGGADIDVDLTAGILGEEQETEIEYFVPARIYTHEEADNLFEQMEQIIDEKLLGDNDSFEHITHNVNLIKTFDQYPFSISWECSDYEYLDADGVIHNDEIIEPVVISIIGECTYEHEHWYLTRNLRICPPELTRAEQIYKELVETIDRNNDKTADEDVLVLPTDISFGSVLWEEKINDDSIYVVIFAMLLCLVLPTIKDVEINQKIKDRSKQLLIEYPAFVSKLTLYMGAGMSVRNCFLRLGRDYEKTKRNSKIKNYLGMELAIAAHELEMGISEIEVYEHFGKRCGTREYMRFSALLTQNLRKGSTDLLRLLNDESNDAFELRKNEAKKLGEEASTKLLVPMVMMLTVVMIIIMVPAYMSFSS